MSRVAELEAMVRVAWTRGTQVAFGPDPEFSRDELRALLGVYADELQQLGDPRGELVALDLLRTPTTDDHARFAALARGWLGPLAGHPNVHTRYGLVGISITDTEPRLLQELLATRGAPYLSSVAIFGDVFTLRSTITSLAAEVRPWLGALRIVVPSPPIGTTLASPILAPELAAQLLEATPALYSLAIGARGLLREFPHPSLRRVIADSHEDLGPLVGVGEPMPAVTDLDLADQAASSVLPPAHWPALRRLDLSRDESPSSIRLFHALAIKRQLTHVRLSALRTLQDRDLLQAALGDMPALERLEVTTVLGRSGDGLRHPTATLVIPAPRPWQLVTGAVVLAFADEEHIVDLATLAAVMERVYDTLPVDARVIWDDWWALVAEDGAHEFPANALAEVFGGIDHVALQEVRTALAAQPEAIVRITPL